MTLKDIAHLRLMNQSIAHPHLIDPADVVRSLGAVQAQDYGQALWAIGLRTKGAAVGDVLRAIESGKILRTWPMRGTIHFVPAEDAKWMVSLVGERSLRSAAARHIEVGLDESDFRKSEELVRTALSGGKRLPRSVLMALLEDNGIATGQQRGYHILWTLSLKGIICIGPMEGKQQTYVLLDEWAPHAKHLTREEGMGELARRYFAGHGPATIVDFATWSSQPLREAKLGLELAKGALTSLTLDGTEYWFSRDAPSVDDRAVAGTYLLAGFEEYLLGYKDRSAALRPGVTPASVNGIFFPIIVVDGEVKGLWKRVIRRNDIVLSLRPFEPLSSDVLAEVHRKTEAYGAFMGMPIVFASS